MKAAFDQLDKNYQLLKLRDEAHGYCDADNQQKLYATMLEFLQKNIGSK